MNLKKYLPDLWRKELTYLLISFVTVYFFFQFLYLKENPLAILRLVFSYYYLFILPGFSILSYYVDSTKFVYRLVLGAGAGLALQGSLVYFVNLFLKVPISKFYFVVPLLLMVLGVFLSRKKMFNQISATE